MEKFSSIKTGCEFEYKGKTFVKLDNSTGVSVQLGKQKIHYFDENELVTIN